MNFLAHLFLAENTEASRLGNIFGDFVKGNLENYTYEVAIKQGILEHRLIDVFTDNHSIVRKDKALISKNNRRYAGIAIDIFYDHFLAVNWHKYSSESLVEFATKMYQLLEENYTILPQRLQFILPYMIRENWFLRYATLEGILKTLRGLSRRLSERLNKENAFAETIHDLESNYETFQADFFVFFSELELFLTQKRAAQTVRSLK